MPASSSLQRILVVDDDRFIRAAVEKSLALGGGYTVRACESGVEAIRQAPDFGPDLILLDVVMPGLDGPATLQALRAMPGTAETPVAFFTATSDQAGIDALRRLGAITVFVKPFNPATLADDLEAAWEAARDPDPGSGAGRLAAELEALRQEYAAALPEEVARLKRDGWEALLPAGSPEALARVRDAVHSLSGSGASFGFRAVTEAAGRLQSGLERQLRQPAPVEPSQRATLLFLLDRLEQAAHEAAREAAGAPPDEARGAPDELPPFDTAPLPGTPGRPRLLIVDDVEAVRRRYALALGAAGFVVDVAAGGEEALGRVRRARYDLVLLDLRMPGMDGFETQRRLRQEPSMRHTPIVFMTATGAVNMRQVQEALALGVSGFAPKSLTLPQLVREIRNALEEAGRDRSPAGATVTQA